MAKCRRALSAGDLAYLTEPRDDYHTGQSTYYSQSFGPISGTHQRSASQQRDQLAVQKARLLLQRNVVANGSIAFHPRACAPGELSLQALPSSLHGGPGSSASQPLPGALMLDWTSPLRMPLMKQPAALGSNLLSYSIPSLQQPAPLTHSATGQAPSAMPLLGNAHPGQPLHAFPDSHLTPFQTAMLHDVTAASHRSAADAMPLNPNLSWLVIPDWCAPFSCFPECGLASFCTYQCACCASHLCHVHACIQNKLRC